ncbi:hypothetical protein ANTPLA_LOCUS713 [Anthophora plagiata]
MLAVAEALQAHCQSLSPCSKDELGTVDVATSEKPLDCCGPVRNVVVLHRNKRSEGPIQKSDSIVNYNKYMKSVDHTGQYLFYYSIFRKTKKNGLKES